MLAAPPKPTPVRAGDQSVEPAERSMRTRLCNKGRDCFNLKAKAFAFRNSLLILVLMVISEFGCQSERSRRPTPSLNSLTHLLS